MRTDTFRFLAHWRLSAVDKNGALRIMLGALRDTSCMKDCQPEIAATDVFLGTYNSLIRYPESRAIATLVTNRGAVDVKIYEDAKLIFILTPGQTKLMPCGGQHLITGDGNGGHIICVTFKRCQCGQPEDPYVPPGNEDAPIGGFLL